MKNRIYWWNQQKKWYLWFFAKQISLFVGRLHTPHKSHQVKWWFVQNFELDCIRSLEGCYWAKCTLLPLQKAFMGRDSSFCENIWGCNTIFDSHLTNNLRPPGYEAVSSTNRSRFGSDLCILPPFARRIFHCLRPALPAFFVFWVKNGSEKILKLQNKSCQAFVQYNFYHVDTRNLECGCRLSILRFRAP